MLNSIPSYNNLMFMENALGYGYNPNVPSYANGYTMQDPYLNNYYNMQQMNNFQPQNNIVKNSVANNTTNLQNSMGLGTQGQMFNPYSGGLTSFVVNQIGTLLSNTNGFKVKEKDGSESTVTFSNDRIQQMMQAQYCGGLKAIYQQKDGKDTSVVDHYEDNQQRT